MSSNKIQEQNTFNELASKVNAALSSLDIPQKIAKQLRVAFTDPDLQITNIPILTDYDHDHSPRILVAIEFMERFNLVKRVPSVGKGDGELYEYTPKAKKLYLSLVSEGVYKQYT